MSSVPPDKVPSPDAVWDPPREQRPVPEREVEPVFSVPAEVLEALGARVLDPSTAVRTESQRRRKVPLRPTVYISDRLLVRGGVDEGLMTDIEAAAKANHLTVDFEADAPRRERLLALARSNDVSPELLSNVVRVTFAPVQDPAPAVNVWPVLQALRTNGARPGVTVSLDHVMTATSGIGGLPVWDGHGIGGLPVWDGHGIPASQYGTPGWGGRMPASWVGLPPARRSGEVSPRRPVVAVLDTGCGAHTWFTEGVDRDPEIGGVPLSSLLPPLPDGELEGVDPADALVGTLGPDAGHGTFITGIIRQACPDADVLAIRVMPISGAVAEGDLLDALDALLVRQRSAADPFIDVISMSLGYYHELPADEDTDALLLTPLRALADLGTVIVTSSGNDATARLMYPACFAPHPTATVTVGEKSVPLISVGALNPNGSVALFSNDGDWVTTRRRGASVLSTLPMTYNASAQPSYRVTVAGLANRETIDPDDYTGGFGIWSGTSFSAPLFAGQVAQWLLTSSTDLHLTAPETAVSRARAAVQGVLALPENS